MRLSFFVQGCPKPQPRPRSFARKLSNGITTARMYDAGTAEGWKSCIADQVRRSFSGEQFTGPLRVALAFRFARPGGHTGTRGLKPSAPSSHCQRPDVDNLAKAVLDCLTTLQVWADDDQIVEMTVSKRWALGEPQGCEVLIESMSAALLPADGQLTLAT